MLLPNLLVAILLATPLSFAAAQVQASELATLSQVVDGTRMTIQGSRPRGRERAILFGSKDVIP